jgi:hypothetical protein
VGAAPYWIDDISIRDSVNASAPTASNNAKRTSIAFRDEKSKGVRRGGAQSPKEKKYRLCKVSILGH